MYIHLINFLVYLLLNTNTNANNFPMFTKQTDIVVTKKNGF